MVERIHLRTGHVEDAPLGVADGMIQRECRIDMKHMRFLRARDAGNRFGSFDALFCYSRFPFLQALQLARLLHGGQSLLDVFQKVPFAYGVGWTDHTQIASIILHGGENRHRNHHGEAQNHIGSANANAVLQPCWCVQPECHQNIL